MEYAIVFACSENGVIGKDNTIPWKINLDMKLFKKLTENNIVIMGRKTYESIGKPLKNRINIVVTKNPNYNIPHDPHDNVIIAHSLQDALNIAEPLALKGSLEVIDHNKKLIEDTSVSIFDKVPEDVPHPKKIMIIGGKGLIEEALPNAGAVYKTTVLKTINDDNTVALSKDSLDYIENTLKSVFSVTFDPELDPVSNTEITAKFQILVKFDKDAEVPEEVSLT